MEDYMIKIFASDMDGTLLNDNHLITNRTAQAIKQLQESGIQFIISTGRSYNSAAPLLFMHGIKVPMINLNGAVFTDINGVAHNKLPLDYQIVLDMINFAKNNNLTYSVMTADNYYMENPNSFIQHIKSYIEQNKHESNLLTQLTEDSSTAQFIVDTDYIHHLDDFNLTSDHRPLKMMILSNNQHLKQKFIDTFNPNESIDIVSSGPDNLEITNHRAQKGLALKSYVESLGLTMDNVAAIGDSLNDRSMLKMAKYSFAMDNAPNNIKALTRFQAPDNHDEGVARVIEDILAGKYDI